MNAIRLRDAINDLSVVDTLLHRNRIADARQMLIDLSVAIADIWGGTKEVCDLLDKWQVEFCKRYTDAYSNQP